MNGLLEFLQRIGPARLGAMGAVSAILVGFFAFIILRLSEPPMTPLYTDLAFDDSAAIIRQLESMDVSHEVRSNGATILVARDDVLRLRMRLAEDGLPTGGSVGYEIFDKSSSFGTTSFVQNINHVRALEGELARTIRTIDRVSSARVHLVLPERELFRRERTEPSASIVLKVRGALESNQIRAVQHLVASAVEGLKPGRVSIVDETGRLLATGNDEDGVGAVGSRIMEQRTALERQMRQQIEDIVGQVVGPGRTRVQVAAELDFNRVTQTADVFDPESQVVRSTQSRAENSSSNEAGSGDAVSIGSQLPGGGSAGGEESVREASSAEEETVNYEISRTTKTEITEAGQIKRLSVAVLVDGLYNKGANGDIAYAPRPQEQIDQIAALVRSAIGYDQGRGDQVEVVNLQFAEGPPTEIAAEPGSFIELNKQDYLYFIELAVIALLTLTVLFFVVRPLLKRVLAPEDVGQPVARPEDGAVPALTSETAHAAQLPAPAADPEVHSEALDAAQAAGSVQANSISRVGTLVEHNPSEAVAIVRAWMNQAA